MAVFNWLQQGIPINLKSDKEINKIYLPTADSYCRKWFNAITKKQAIAAQ